MGTLTDRQRHEHTPPPCPVCGRPTTQQWVNALEHGQDPEDPDTPQWVPSLAECDTHGEHAPRGHEVVHALVCRDCDHDQPPSGLPTLQRLQRLTPRGAPPSRKQPPAGRDVRDLPW